MYVLNTSLLPDEAYSGCLLQFPLDCLPGVPDCEYLSKGVERQLGVHWWGSGVSIRVQVRTGCTPHPQSYPVVPM